MFGFTDTKTAVIAERLYARASRDAERYLQLSLKEVGERVTTDVPETNRFISNDQVAYGYDDLPDFHFAVMSFLGPLTLSIDSGGPFSGMMLQFSAARDGATVAVQKPARTSVGPKAGKLAERLEATFGVSYLNRSLGPLMRQRY